MRERAQVSVPASSANLGPAFDCAGLAYDLRDEFTVEVVDGPAGVVVTAVGEGEGQVPLDERHLVAQSLLLGLRTMAGAAGQMSLRLHCVGCIPHGRGLGSSAAAIIGGLALARAVVDSELDDAGLLQVALQMESHPDNLSAALFGGFTLSWLDGDGSAQARRIAVHEQVRAIVAIPEHRTPTGQARQTLPDAVAFGDAAFNAGRAALLGVALTGEPELLFAATEDRLHQQARRDLYPQSLAAVQQLRGDGWAAVISGAGPTVLVLTQADKRAAGVAAVTKACAGWQVLTPDIAGDGVLATV